jgi:translocation and assembly module TamA
VLLLALALSAPAAPVAYEARIEGVAEVALLTLLQNASDTLALTQEPPASLLQLRRRADQDVTKFAAVFQSQGYYGAEMDYSLESEAVPVRVVFRAQLGSQYLLSTVRVIPLEGQALPEDLVPTPQELGVVPGAPALADAIAGGDGNALSLLRQRGYPAPRIAKRDVVVQHATQTVAVTYRLDVGTRATFGPLQTAGLERVKVVVIESLVPWEAGAQYDQQLLTGLRNQLYDTGLFSTVAVQPVPEEIDAGGQVPIRVTVTERPSRTIAVGLEYKTDEGAGTHVQWEQRNIKGLGHKLSLGATVAMQLRDVHGQYRIERFRRPDQGLTISGEIAQEDRDAYAGERMLALVMVDRKVRPQLTLGAGAGLRISQVEQNDVKDTHQLLYFPLESRWDRSDDLLNPTTGFRLRTRLEPYLAFSGESPVFLKADAEFSHYLPLGRFETAEGEFLDNWVLATRLHIASIVGAERDDIPADIRLYGGGGGSIRGYAFQSVGPLDAEDDPLGGRALGELSIEIRKRLTKNIGIVGFVDGGSVVESSFPKPGGELQWGAGTGLRYFTPLGPLRLDLAVPLNKREVDASFQIYLSIGQAF